MWLWIFGLKFLACSMRISLSIFLIFFCVSIQAQQFNAEVIVNSDRISASANPVFDNLQQSIERFINQTNWNGIPLEDYQKIDCQVSFIVTEAVDFTRFSGILQIQASRPVYGSSYTTTLINFQDAEVGFVFNEFQALNYNENSVNSNLEAVLAYYAFLILGLEDSSFNSSGESDYFEQAENIVNLGQQNGYTGWANRPSDLNRYSLIKALRSSSQSWYLEFWYNYHRQGLDQLVNGDAEILFFTEQLAIFEEQSRSRYNNFLKRMFFDSKLDEIVGIYQAGNDSQKEEVTRILERQAPSYQSIWTQITK